MAIDPSTWLLTASPAGDGKPWGTQTNMAQRATSTTSKVWDENCKVTTYIGGYAALCEMRDQLEKVIANAKSSAAAFGQRGHVYFANFRFNCQRDLSSANQWKNGAWPTQASLLATPDQTAIGLVLRLMQAGVNVRILVWLPTFLQSLAAGLDAHALDHVYLSNVIQKENARLVADNHLTSPIGIVGLDRRTADGALASAHHQKMMLIRSPEVNVAFCGGVDLAFTRRDAPTDPDHFDAEVVENGDWQSGSGIPDPTLTELGTIWPPDASTNYTSASQTKPWDATHKQPSDLPANTNTREVCLALGGQWSSGTCTYTMPDKSQGTLLTVYGDSAQYWHDQHLKLEGSIVATLEWQFCERWRDPPLLTPKILRALGLSAITSELLPGSVSFSAGDAWVKDSSGDPASVVPLDDPVEPVAAAGDSTVQMWRTIPLRSRPTGLFDDGEFTVMAGVAKAMAAATELIWIFDQYFWSEPAARLLNNCIRNSASLNVLIVLPPHADSQFPIQHRTRQQALSALTENLTTDQKKRVAVYNLWHPQGLGVYVHAKSHTYDGSLLVCGSANMNRRSFTCDTEITCAVVDPVVVADHQKKLWTMLFGASNPMPSLDWSQTGAGAQFFSAFTGTAQASGVYYLAPDPWDDANPLNASPKPPALPNGVPRPPAVIGPLYEVMGGIALDPGSMRPKIENDIVDATLIPRPCRLDDVAYNVDGIYLPGDPTKYPLREKAGLIEEQVFRLPSLIFYADGYHFTDQLQWWKEFCTTLPCCLPMGWPGYETGVIEFTDTAKTQKLTVDGKEIVIQLWRGWCPRLFEIKGMPGGIGAEFGVYRRIPGQLKTLLGLPVGNGAAEQKLTQLLPQGTLVNDPQNSYTSKLRLLLDQLSTASQSTIDALDAAMWWPFPELDITLQFTLKNPTTGTALFTAGPEKTWWLTKWMDMYEYKVFAADPANQVPGANQASGVVLSSWDYDMEITLTGESGTPYSNVWKKGDSIQSFGRV